jgi:hypothetical protein
MGVESSPPSCMLTLSSLSCCQIPLSDVVGATRRSTLSMQVQAVRVHDIVVLTFCPLRISQGKAPSTSGSRPCSL